MSDVLCPVCSAANPAGSQFCEACGAELGVAAPAGVALAGAASGPRAVAVPGGGAVSPAGPATPAGVPGGPAPAGARHAGAEVGAPDTGSPDAGSPERGPLDAGSPDAGPLDAAEAEAPQQQPPPNTAVGDGTGPGPEGPAPVSDRNVDPDDLPVRERPAVPAPPVAGQESPLDIGWTGVVPGRANPYDATPRAVTCVACGEGSYSDGYCDHCGAKQPNPRDHLEETPASWVAGASDIGRRHTRNEDSLALTAESEPGSRAVLVVCDGVSNTTDSDRASLAAARAARTVLDQPLSAGVGTPETIAAAAIRRLADSVAAASKAVVAVAGVDDPAPPSCTFTAAIVTGATAHVGNVGDSRIYWLPDAGEGAEQLSRDDSVAADRIAAGVERKEAETGPMAHSITRWLGIDQPDDVTPHTRTIEMTEPGWLMLCSDGLWNYCSEAGDLRALITSQLAAGVAPEPLPLARSLVDFANNAGGVDNITVALARIGPPPEPIVPEPEAEPATSGEPAASGESAGSGAPGPVADADSAVSAAAESPPEPGSEPEPAVAPEAAPGEGMPATAPETSTDARGASAAADLAGSMQQEGGPRGDIHR